MSQSDVEITARSASYTFAGVLIGKAALFLTLVFLARSLGVEALGVYTLGLAIIRICEILGRFGLNNGAMRYVAIYKSQHPEKLSGIVNSSLASAFFLCVLISLMLLYASHAISVRIFHNELLTRPLEIFAVSIPLITLVNVLAGIFRGFHAIKYVALVRDVIQPLVNLILVILLVANDFGLVGCAYALLFSYFLSVLIGLLVVKKLLRSFPGRAEFHKQDYKSLLLYSAPLLFVGLLDYLLNWIDMLLLGYFSNEVSVGIYRAGSELARLMTLILFSLNAVYGPMIASYHSENKIGQMASLYKLTTRWITYIVLPIFIILVTSPEFFMRLFLNQGYAVGNAVLCILCLGQLVNCLTGGVGLLMMMTENQKLALGCSIAMIVLSISLNVVLIPRYEVLGAAISFLVSMSLINLLRIVIVYRLFKIHPYSVALNRYVIFSLLILLLLFLLNSVILDASYLALNCVIVLIMVAGYFAIGKVHDERDQELFDLIRKYCRKFIQLRH